MIYLYGSRNLALIARELNVSKSSVYQRFYYLKRQGLRVGVIPRYYHLGLMPTLLVFRVNFDLYSEVERVIRSNPFIVWAYKSVGYYNGIFGLMLLPDRLLYQPYKMISSFTVENTELILSNIPYPLIPNFDIYDARNKNWMNFDKWKINPMILDDFHDIFVDDLIVKPMIDKIDLYILNKLMEDETYKFKDIAKELNVEKATITYHYNNHIKPLLLDKRYISFNVFADATLNVVLEIQSQDKLGLIKCIGLLSQTPYFYIVFKEFKRNRAILMGNLPADHLKILSELIEQYISELDITCAYYSFLVNKIIRKDIPLQLFDEENRVWKVSVID